MKKLLKVSLVAVLAVAPFTANAALTQASKANIAANTNVATTSFVGGAHDALVDIINPALTQIDTNTTAIAGKQAQLKNDATGTPADISSTVKTSVATTAASDTALVTEKAVRDAITAATATTTYQAGSGLALDTTTNTFSASGITTSNIDANANIAKTQLATDVQTSLGLADTALQSSDITSTYTASDTSKAVTGSAVASAISGKADAATTLSGYGITDAYTKTEVDTALDNKADKTDVGTLSSLTTTDKSSLVGAINEVVSSAGTQKGFAVYGTWGQPTTATGHVNVVNSSTLNP